MNINNNNLLMLTMLALTFIMWNWITMSNAQPFKIDVFILAGQSNMAGRGGVYYINNMSYWDGQVPPESSADPSKIFRLNANLTWEVAKDPLHQDIDTAKTNGVGPGMTFANGIKQYVEAPIGLVPCAIGDTDITRWARGKTCYENMVKRTKAATLLGGEIKGLLWYQGESDAGNDTTVNSYRMYMENLIKNVRTDLNLPSLPVIQVAIAGAGNKADPRLVEGIRNIQKSIRLPNVSWVDAWGLECYPPHFLHLTTNSQVKLGLMLSKEYLDNFTTQTSPGRV